MFFFIVLCVFKVLINRVNCVCFKVLDNLLLLIQRYEKISRYANVLQGKCGVYAQNEGFVQWVNLNQLLAQTINIPE